MAFSSIIPITKNSIIWPYCVNVCQSTCIPIVTKNIPSKISLNGTRSASILYLYLLSASIIPAKNAPKEYEKPKLSAKNEVDITTNNTETKKISSLCVDMTQPKYLSIRYLLTIKNAAKTIVALIKSSPSKESRD